MKILLTGATGFIGGNLLKKLLKEGHEVTIIVRSSSKISEFDLRFQKIIYDGTYNSLEKISGEIDVVIHLATMFISNHLEEDIEKLIGSNILFGTHLLEYMSKNKIKKIINTETYAESINGTEYNPQNLYAATKKAYKNILKYYVDRFEMKAISLVLSDTYGPNDPRKKFINLVLDNIKKSEEVFNMSLGEQEICYIHIEDVINAYLIALKQIETLKEKELLTYSVFGNEVLTLIDLVRKIEQIYNVKVNVNRGFYDYRNREIMKFNYNIKRLENWEPEISLNLGIKHI